MTGCISEPISYLRLERYLVDEVDTHEREDVRTHLEQCGACRECFEALRADTTPLPALPVPLRSSRPKRDVLRMVLWPTLAAAAAWMLLLGKPNESEPGSHAPLAGTKGGDLAITLVREHRGSIAVDATRFTSGDRFEVQVTCAASEPQRWDLVVYQGGDAFFPLTPGKPLHCGNRVTLPGAFTLTGVEPARVCVVVHATAAPDRGRLARSVPDDASACGELLPAR